MAYDKALCGGYLYTMDPDRWGLSKNYRSIRMSDDELNALEARLVPVAEVILSETVDGEIVVAPDEPSDVAEDIAKAINGK